ncbi:MAG: NAD(P)-dependent oxidoreductase [Nitrososphaerota archaeon]|nr:NAD(P)-dependent oxidoreductase [Nitrososphaerota archaeon]
MERLKILITGATGFVGANLARYFHGKGHTLAVTLRHNSNVWRLDDLLDDVKTFRIDLTDKEAANLVFGTFKPDVVIHTAAFGGYHFETGTKQIFDVNLYGTINLVDAFIKFGGGVFINTGSSSEYGSKDRPMKESEILNPYGPYAVSKAAATLYSGYRASETGRRLFTLRLFSPYGYYEEMHRLVPHLLISTIAHRTAKLNNPEHVRDYIFIDDVSGAYEALINNSPGLESGEIFNVGSGNEIQVGDMVKFAEEASGHSLEVEWGANEQRTGDRAKHWIADISKIKKGLGWSPETSIQTGMARSYKWFVENISKYEVIENSKIGRTGK